MLFVKQKKKEEGKYLEKENICIAEEKKNGAGKEGKYQYMIA